MDPIYLPTLINNKTVAKIKAIQKIKNKVKTSALRIGLSVKFPNITSPTKLQDSKRLGVREQSLLSSTQSRRCLILRSNCTKLLASKGKLSKSKRISTCKIRCPILNSKPW
jgi:hypothetical protein